MNGLYHFTCRHGFLALGAAGELVPAVALEPSLAVWWPSRYVWLTDLPEADRMALGLTSVHIACDRTEYRYRVTNPTTCYRWQFARGRHLESPALGTLESEADPATWWVSTEPVPVEHAP